jgi:hypothetical protein
LEVTNPNHVGLSAENALIAMLTIEASLESQLPAIVRA